MENKFEPSQLIEEIIKRLETSEDPSHNNAPDLTRKIYEIDAPGLQDVLKFNEFDLVCAAIDNLINDGKIIFNPENGEIKILEQLLSAGPATTSPGPQDFD